jgi:hypothetical protein
MNRTMPAGIMVALALVPTACGESDSASQPAATTEGPTTTTAPTATTAKTTGPASKPKPSQPENEPAILREAKQAASGSSYTRDLKRVKRVVRNGDGVDVHTDLFYDDEGKMFARRVAAPFVSISYTPTRVYAGNGELLLKLG